jgi:hypothetical protein
MNVISPESENDGGGKNTSKNKKRSTLSKYKNALK